MTDVHSWGIERKINLDAQNQCVTAERYSSIPKIKVMDDWVETVIDGLLFKFPLEVISQKTLQNIVTSTFGEIASKIISNSSPLLTIINGQIENVFFKNANTDISEGLLQKHISGKDELKFNSINRSNETNYVLYESEDIDTVKKLILFLNHLHIPYVLEKVRDSMRSFTYRIWIFTEPEYAFISKKFAMSILDIAGIKYRNNTNIRVYPKQTARNYKEDGDILTLPFGFHSKILVDGEFVPVQNIDVGIVKIPNNIVEYNGFVVNKLYKIRNVE